MDNKICIGVLSFQGSVAEHIRLLDNFKNVTPLEVKTLDSLNKVDALILPGGESTTISKLLKIFGIAEPLKKRISDGMPVWGTCAGLILLAKNIIDEIPHLNKMDITVRRNAYGTQSDSFVTNKKITAVSDTEIPLVFIRAPWIENVDTNVTILCKINNHIVAARQNNMLVTSFHPELTNDISFHNYFINMVKQSLSNNNI